MSNTNSQSMTVHSATFVTQRGDRRDINFVRPSEAPEGTFPTYLRERIYSLVMRPYGILIVNNTAHLIITL